MTEGINIFHDFLKGDGDWSKNVITLKTNKNGKTNNEGEEIINATKKSEQMVKRKKRMDNKRFVRSIWCND
jgi:hypothetical protein